MTAGALAAIADDLTGAAEVAGVGWRRGLGAEVHTQAGLAPLSTNLNCAQRFADGLRAGVVGINDPRPITPEAPFGGVGQSGMGREGGVEGLLEFMDARLIGLRLPG